jgi:hypothetical protein
MIVESSQVTILCTFLHIFQLMIVAFFFMLVLTNKSDSDGYVHCLPVTPARFRPPGPPLPRPVLPRERSVLDRLMEYLIGDGPQNRYALICAQCQSHNGMALREEFEYIGSVYLQRM